MYEKIELSSLIPLDNNPRKISKKSLEDLRNSINEFGFVDPIIINMSNNHIISGHQRCLVLNEDGVEELYLLRLGDVGWCFPETDLEVVDDAHEMGLNIGLNKISGEWDNEILKEMDLTLTDIDIEGNVSIEQEEVTGDEKVDEESDFYSTYTLVFDTNDEFDRFLKVLDALVERYPDRKSMTDRILAFISEIGEL